MAKKRKAKEGCEVEEACGSRPPEEKRAARKLGSQGKSQSRRPTPKPKRRVAKTKLPPRAKRCAIAADDRSRVLRSRRSRRGRRRFRRRCRAISRPSRRMGRTSTPSFRGAPKARTRNPITPVLRSIGSGSRFARPE